MVTAAMLAVVFTATPAFLTDGPRRVRLVADDAAPPPELNDFTGWTRTQLKAEHDRLAALRPTIGLPITLMAVGGGAFITAFYLWVTFGGASTGPAGLPLLILLAVVGVISAGLIIIGGIVLSRLLPERRAVGRQMDRIQALAESRPDDARRPSRTPAPEYVEPEIIGPPPEGPPPLPLPPMPQSAAPSPSLVLARF